MAPHRLPGEVHMLDAEIWKLDGTGEKMVCCGGVVIEVTQMTFYRHRVTNQLKIIYREAQR
jgi:hypothetical protein